MEISTENELKFGNMIYQLKVLMEMNWGIGEIGLPKMQFQYAWAHDNKNENIDQRTLV